MQSIEGSMAWRQVKRSQLQESLVIAWTGPKLWLKPFPCHKTCNPSFARPLSSTNLQVEGNSPIGQDPMALGTKAMSVVPLSGWTPR